MSRRMAAFIISAFFNILSSFDPRPPAGMFEAQAKPSTAPKPPLCKGRWHGEAVTEGL
jgi:hypothetical protein